MASDFYLKIDGIDGESMSQGVENQLQLLSWSFGASNPGSSRLGTGASSGKVSMQDFHFVIQNGKASPKLLGTCCSGKHIKKATLTCRKSGDGTSPMPFLEFLFEDVVITSYQTGGSEGSQDLPTDQIAFNFTKMTNTYFQQKADGKLTRADNSSYDVKSNVTTGSA